MSHPCLPIDSRRQQKGFTLIELVIVIVILGIVSISLSGILRSAVDAVLTVEGRENLVREGSFLVERFNRELRGAVPNSVRVSGNAISHCIEFVPLKWSTVYLSLPLLNSSDVQADVLELSDIRGRAYVPQTSDVAFVFPTSADDVYSSASDNRQAVVSCSDDDGDCSTLTDSDKIVQIRFADGFAQTSPSRRMYFADSTISYCLRDNAVYRHTGTIAQNQTIYTSGGVLMAQNLVNTLGSSPAVGEQNPFFSIAAGLNRNGATQALFIFGLDGENLTFMQEVQVPNVP